MLISGLVASVLASSLGSAAATAIEWAPDYEALWTCHLYAVGEDDHWCATVNFSQGYQFVHAGGLGASPCMPCMCCQRRAKRVTTRSSTTAVPATAPSTSQEAQLATTPASIISAPAAVASTSHAVAVAMNVIAPSLAGQEANLLVSRAVTAAPTAAPSKSNAATMLISGAATTSMAALPIQEAMVDALSVPPPAPSTTSAPSDGFVKHAVAIEGLAPVLLAGSGGSVRDGQLTIEHNSGLTLFSKFEDEWEPDNIVQLKVLGKMLSFTVDLSQVGCACNLAFYLISSPALGWDGKPSRGSNRDGQPPYYCDANMVGGQWCPEIDIMEANNHAFQATPHKCDAPSNGHYGSCDRGGCEQNTRDRESAYGPGDHYTIDTRRPFQVKTEFLETSGVFSGMRTALSQGDHQIVLDHSSCTAEYLANMNEAISAGMSLRITYWGDSANTMAWMDSPPCGQQSCAASAGKATISNITIGALPKAELTEWPTEAPTTTTTTTLTQAPVWTEAPTSTSTTTTRAPPAKHAIAIAGLKPVLLVGSGGSVDGGELTIEHNSGFTLFSKFEDDWEPKNIEQLKVLGKMLSFTVDLSRVGCACNLAFYLISTPALGWDGKPSRGSNRDGQPPYYCDANQVGGQWCPEIDIMEANNHAFQSTPHKCDKPVNGHYNSCDRGGCEESTRDVEGAYGPGQAYTIDTRHPFEVLTAFFEDNGNLIGVQTTLRQAGREVVLKHSKCKRRYLAALSEAMASGMSLRITYWGDKADTMAWMDAPPCGQQSCGANAGKAVISNVTIDRLVWAVSDPQDKLFHHVVPEEIIKDSTRFVSMGGLGVVKWQHDTHYVQRQPVPVGASLPGLKDCDDGSAAPCKVSLRKSKDLFLQGVAKKYEASPSHGVAAALPARSFGSLTAAAMAVCLLALGMLGAVRFGRASAQRHSERLAPQSAPPSAPAAGAGTEVIQTNVAGIAGHGDASGSASSFSSRAHPLLPRSGSSCQRLLAIVD